MLYLLLNRPKIQRKQYPFKCFSFKNDVLVLWKPFRWLNGTIIITSSRFTQLGIAMMRTFRKQNEQVYISSTTTTLSVSVSLIAVIPFNVPSCTSVFLTLKYQCSLNSWMALFFTKSGEFEHWTETVLPASLILYFICHIYIHLR